MEDLTPQVIELHDNQSGFAAWHAECRGKFKRGPVSAGHSPFETQGFQRFRVLSPAAVAATLEHLRQLQNDDRSTWGEPHVEWIKYHHRRDAGWIYDLLCQVLNGEIDNAITGFFHSEYLVHSVGFPRTFPAAPANDYSYLWHRDAGPSAHLKLIVYLTSGRETGAGTEFLDIGLTGKVAAAGYSFPPLAERTTDLSAWFERIGQSYTPPQAFCEAGEAVLFRPRDVLHRGFFAKTAERPRYAIALVLAPSTRHWRQAYKLWPLYAAQVAVGVMVDTQYAPVLRGEARVRTPDE